MAKHEFDRLFDRLDSLTVGFGPLFRSFETATSGYPPHNIVKFTDNSYMLELAVAGFKKDEISIEELNGELVIKGNKNVGEKELSDQYQYRGIGQRSFDKRFKLAEYIEPSGAVLEDGLLSIILVKNEPEAAKPKLISIK